MTWLKAVVCVRVILCKLQNDMLSCMWQKTVVIPISLHFVPGLQSTCYIRSEVCSLHFVLLPGQYIIKKISFLCCFHSCPGTHTLQTVYYRGQGLQFTTFPLYTCKTIYDLMHLPLEWPTIIYSCKLII